MNINALLQKWHANAEAYKTAELGGGVQDFVNDVLTHPDLFALRKTPRKTAAQHTYVHDTEAGKHGRPDFVLYVNKDVTMPCEVKCYTRIEEGIKQLQRYRTDYTKEYGILTDGFTWRFYRSHSYEIWTLDQILESPKLFRTFWDNYLTPENYYTEIFQPSGQKILFEEPINLNDTENQKIFFKETSRLIAKFRTKIKVEDNKTALETSYAYLIQFILYKSLVDNQLVRFEKEYKRFKQQIVKAIRDKDLYNLVVFQIRNISEYITQNIYKPFAEEQQSVNEILIADLQRELTIQDIAPWLDIVAFIDRFDFSNLQNEIFGFVYENYLKDLYGDNWGQNFTDPAVVDFMLDELGYTPKELAKDKTKISIIDPACGAGTFLYSAVDRIVEAFEGKGTKTESVLIKELVDKNVFGLDIAEFPLFLAEMCIFLRQLPLIVNDLYNSPVENKLKLFKTRDSISEFIDTGITSQETPVDLFSHLKERALDYNSFMRDDENLTEMLLLMQSNGQDRLCFDYVIGNPPYVGYNACAKQGMDFVKKIQDSKNKFNMGDVFGVNLHSVPGRPKKNVPKPNLYAFFIALGQALLKSGGKMSFIIPQNILQSRDLDVVRYHLANAMTIEKIITFEANMFIGRGLSMNKTIPTSSLIFLVSKKLPKENHKVRIVNYQYYTEKQKGDFERYLKSRNKQIKAVDQSELLKRFENWNFVTEDDNFLPLLEKYKEHSLSIEEYRRQVLDDYNDVCFDIGYLIDERTLSDTPEYYMYPHIDKRYFTIKSAKGYWAKDREIKLLRANRGHLLLSMRYKILWRYNNPDKFHFTDKNVISSRNNICFLGHNNKEELLFILSLLNSPLNWFLLNKLLRVASEKSVLIGLSSIKDYIRIPKITARNQKLKDKIIALTESMLALESVTLRDLVDFAKLNVQKFDTIGVEKNELVLSNGKEFRLKIADGKAKLIQKVVHEKYRDDELLRAQSIAQADLKSLPAIDFDERDAIKKAIDDLVFALYFDVSVNGVAKHEFYDYVNLQ